MASGRGSVAPIALPWDSCGENEKNGSNGRYGSNGSNDSKERKIASPLPAIAPEPCLLTQDSIEDKEVIPSEDQITLSWHDLSLVIDVKKKKGGGEGGPATTKALIDNVSGVIKPGEMVAIMGPSGSGKTTLLDVLARRAAFGTQSGRVLANGAELSIESCRRNVSYVAQEDTLMGVFTVRETLMYSALFTLPTTLSRAEREARVEVVMRSCGLVDAADVIVGNLFRKGLSGGQKRRLSMAVEIIRKPSVILLDEPTSGLDAMSAMGIVRELHMFCSVGHTVAMTIHQPSSQLWELFDKCLLLTRGRCAYFGGVHKAIEHFYAIGRPVPQYTNPADHYIHLINDDFRRSVSDEDAQSIKSMVAQVVLAYPGSDADKARARELAAVDERGADGIDALSPSAKPTRNGVLHEFLVLCRRNLQNNARNPGIYYVRLVMYAMLCLMLGLVFVGVGDRNKHEDIQSRVNLLWYTSSFLIFMSVAVLPFFIEDRAVFLREKDNGWYGVGPYVTANAVTALPGIFLIALLSSAALIPLAGMQGFGKFLFILFLGLCSSEAMMTLIAVPVPHYVIGIAIGAGMFGFFMLCQGVLLVLDDIPAYFIWGYYIALHTYVFRAMLLNEVNEDDEYDSLIWPTGESLLKYFGFEDNDYWEDCAVVIGYGLLFHIIVYIVLSREKASKK